VSRTQASTIIILLLFVIALGLYAILVFRPVPVETVLVENHLPGRSNFWVDTMRDVQAGEIITVSGELDLLPMMNIQLNSSSEGQRVEAMLSYAQKVGPDGMEFPLYGPVHHLDQEARALQSAYLYDCRDCPPFSVIAKVGTSDELMYVGSKARFYQNGRLYLRINFPKAVPPVPQNGSRRTVSEPYWSGITNGAVRV
jgi:hypothetical protein